jgi:hypothetical protein
MHTLDNKQICDKLISLCHLDIDAWRAYEQAISNCTHQEVINKLRAFQGDHDRHIRDLSAHILKFGGTPPERKPDFKGFFLEGMTSVRSITGTAGALKAMDMNERLTTSRYKAAMDLELPTDCRDLVLRNYSDEKRHLAWIQDAIARKIWVEEGPSASAPM